MNDGIYFRNEIKWKIKTADVLDVELVIAQARILVIMSVTVSALLRILIIIWFWESILEPLSRRELENKLVND